MNPAPKPLQIRPGVGLGDITLGMSREEVRQALGEPDEFAKDSLPEHPGELWSYDRLKVYTSFPADSGYRLSFLVVEHEDVELFGERLMGMPEDRVRSVLRSFGLEELEVIGYSGQPSARELSYGNSGLSLKFVQDQLKQVWIFETWDRTAEPGS